MSKLHARLAAVAFATYASLASAAVFEDWSAPQISVGGTFNYPTGYTIWDASQRWVYNNWDPNCNAAPAGPNGCYATSNNRLYLHAEKKFPDGDGFLFASLNPISFPTGLIAEVQVVPSCTQVAGASGCGWNLGIYENEFNYRAIGILKDINSGRSYFNVWGPCYEAAFDGALHPTATPPSGVPNCAPSNTPTVHTDVSTPLGNAYTLKVQYWNSSSGWRWDYFLNGTWIAGHPAAPDNQYNLGPAYFPNRAARIVLAAFSYAPRPAGWSGPYNAAEGHFGPVNYWVF
ncbi:hypothetical protein [Corallococcus llansteffanensis]|uniref:hypothetical protein n=1 Tax=Corallococcus llansteffanensis TaxID=2316731 RepID=UPI0011C45691|nr:hypothetical protein [Corallococcus llansteffanensis]